MADKNSGIFLYVQVRIAGTVQAMLVPRMLQQVPVGDRHFLFRRYKRCFSGTDAVRFFLAKRFARNEHEALAVGNALLKAGVLRHVRNEHLFRTGEYFYRFAAHEDYAVDDECVNLRSSRMMSVACNSYMAMPEISRIDTGPILSNSNYSDATLFSYEDCSVFDDRPEFDETDVVVETGIRIGKRVFPNLVSNFTHAKDLVGTNAVRTKIFDKSFTGRAAVKWLIRHHYAKSIAESVSIGNAMLSSGVFYPLEFDASNAFGLNLCHYRMMADTDISKELKRGARKDMMLRWLGLNRSRSGASILQQQTPWFEDAVSFSFTSISTGSMR